jgi:hypothetical protein
MRKMEMACICRVSFPYGGERDKTKRAREKREREGGLTLTAYFREQLGLASYYDSAGRESSPKRHSTFTLVKREESKG